MIKRANRRFLRQNSSTDVLAFGMNQGKTKYLIADIMISTDTALQNAKLFKTLPLYEVELYCVHGLLHLLGYDDQTLRQSRIMRRKEEKYVHS